MRFMFKSPSPTCRVHHVTEGRPGHQVYPYLCPRCGQCFQCQHTRLGYRFWLCPTGGLVRTHFGPGVPVSTPTSDLFHT